MSLSLVASTAKQFVSLAFLIFLKVLVVLPSNTPSTSFMLKFNLSSNGLSFLW